MDGANLNTASNSGGTQASTQSPQSNVTSGSLGGGTTSGSIQSGNSSTYLNSSQTGGLSLKPTSLNSVNLNSIATSTPSISVSSPTSKSTHHINAGFLIFALVLLVFAVGMTMQITKSAKITTE